MSEQDKGPGTKLTNVRHAFPSLFVARGFNGGEENKKFEDTFLIPKTDPQVKTIMADMMAAAVAKWGGKAQDELKKLFASERVCFRDGDKVDYEGFAGHFALKTANPVRPPVFDRVAGPDGKPMKIETDNGRVYSGCFVNATVSFWAQDNKFGKRMNCNLRGVQYYGPGEAFTGGGVSSGDEFGAEEGDKTSVAVPADDPMAMFT